MTAFRQVTASFAVSPQIGAADVGRASSQGFKQIINNRPDGESPDQPPGAEIEAAARAHGLDYVAIPVTGRLTAEQAKAMAEAAAAGPTLAFCRTGTRSITAWALGQVATGALSREELLRLAAAAGYDLTGVLAAPPRDQ
ncbi:MAG: TIGR01244 family sulfur transferase [Caulobacteraceae bacterium]